ncbi:MAG: GNAT family N-acetyltransferase [Acidobacteriota bacterium]
MSAGQGPTIEVRRVELRDAAAVEELIGELGYARTLDEVQSWIAALDARGESQAALVAVVEGEVVGWIAVAIDRPLQSEAHGHITGLVVKDGRRGLGIGRRLCEAAEGWTRERGVNALRVLSRSTREEAHRFYVRDGYGVVKTSVVFEKRLGDE